MLPNGGIQAQLKISAMQSCLSGTFGKQGHLANSDTAQVTPIAPATTTTPTVPQEDAAKLPDCHGKSKDCVTTGDDVCLKGSHAHERECDGPHDPNCQNSPKFIYDRR